MDWRLMHRFHAGSLQSFYCVLRARQFPRSPLPSPHREDVCQALAKTSQGSEGGLSRHVRNDRGRNNAEFCLTEAS